MSSEFNCPTCNTQFATSRRLSTHAKTHLIELVVIEPSSSLIAFESKKQPLTQLSKADLLEKCTELGITKVKSKTKAELIALIEGDLSVGVKEEGPAKTVSPLVKWSGGKSDEIKQFASHFPSNWDTYLEPFIGGGSVYFHLAPKKAVISDVHQELIDLYQSIKAGHAAEIHQFMTLHPNNEETYYKVRDKMIISSPLGSASSILVNGIPS